MDKDSMVLYGRNSVYERLKANSKSIKKIFIQDSFKVPYIEELIKKKKVAVERLSLKRLQKIKPNKDLQGIVAKVNLFEYLPFEDLLNRPKDKQLAIIFLE